jgi:dynein heavy chain
MVTKLATPRFDVNLTNYVTLINFVISVEGLSQNLLNLVVANEKPDLDTEYNQSLDTVFNSVVKLKQIENETLERLSN